MRKILKERFMIIIKVFLFLIFVKFDVEFILFSSDNIFNL